MVDTGELARASDPSFFYEDRDYRRLIKVAHAAAFSTKLSDEVGPQLARLGINARTDVRSVILTHLHCDHADGLKYFPNAHIMVSRAEFAQTHYAFPRTWPIWFRPTLVDYTDGAFGAFAACKRLTDAGDVLLVPTPGHTFGHQSVMIRSGDRWVCLAGDATHTEGQLSAGEPTGGVADVKTARATLATLSRHRAQLPLLYLPSHDPASPDKLAAWSK